MAKNDNYKQKIYYKIENIKYAIEVEYSYIEQIKKDLEARKERFISNRIIKDKKKLFRHELIAYGMEEYYNQEKQEKLDEFLNKHNLKERYHKQKYLRSLKSIKDEESKKILESQYSLVLKDLINNKEEYIERINQNYSDLISKNGPHRDYEKKYESHVNTVSENFETYKTKLDKIFDNKHKSLTEKSRKRIKSLETTLKNLESNTNSVKHEENLLSNNDILRLDQVTMQFGGLKAVDNLSFEVKEKEIFGLIGPNGAGKTTVFNCITQFYKATSGNIYFLDKYNNQINLNDIKIHNVIKHGIVRTFQNVELIWELSVLDNLLVAGHSKYRSNLFDQIFHTQKFKREELVIKAKAEKILDYLNLSMYKYIIPLGLPYGILKRIELARTLMVDPKLIILDEPAAGLNEAETYELSQTIKLIQKEYNCTIFLVEHDMSLVMDICDTVCAISFGKKLAIGSPEEIQNNKAVQEAYLGGE